MNWYMALGLKIFTVIVLFFQLAIMLFNSIDGYIEEDKKKEIIAVIMLLLFSITIPTVLWTFNLLGG